MTRTTLISASLLLAFAGCTCGQGWRPNFFTRLNNRIHGVSNVGEPCDAGGCHNVPAAPPIAGGCDTCNGATVGYGGYEGQVISSYEGVPGSSTYNGTVTGGTVVGSSAPYDPRIAPPQYQPTTSRMEPVAAKRAN